MEKEIWKPVKGFENIYEVSNLGRVKSLARTIKAIYGKATHYSEQKIKVGKRNHCAGFKWRYYE